MCSNIIGCLYIVSVLYRSVVSSVMKAFKDPRFSHSEKSIVI